MRGALRGWASQLPLSNAKRGMLPVLLAQDLAKTPASVCLPACPPVPAWRPLQR